LPGPGRGVQAVAGIPAVLVLDPVPAEVRHVAVNVRQGHGGHEVQIHVHNVDLIQRPVTQGRVPGLLEIAEEIPQVQKVFVHGPLGVGFDGLVVRE
ncbi:Antibiotic biosynthesis monooxygenase, partial [Dysosmobacter welbionis]